MIILVLKNKYNLIIHTVYSARRGQSAHSRVQSGGVPPLKPAYRDMLARLPHSVQPIITSSQNLSLTISTKSHKQKQIFKLKTK